MVHSHRHFDLTCPQETYCFIFYYPSFWDLEEELQFILTCFFGSKAPEMPIFSPFLDDAIPQCNYSIKTLLFFMFNVFPPFDLSLYMLSLDIIWTTLDPAGISPIYKRSFSKSFDTMFGFSFFGEIFFLIL